jgi:hypothetical protein
VIGTIGIIDHGWYEFLRSQGNLTEVNFWKPSARRGFRAPEFLPFLFKLRAPHNAICGFAYFASFSNSRLGWPGRPSAPGTAAGGRPDGEERSPNSAETTSVAPRMSAQPLEVVFVHTDRIY